jgi:hypothetical protein
MTIRQTALCFACCSLFALPVYAQDAGEKTPADATEKTEEKSTTEKVKEEAEEAFDEANEQVDDIKQEVDESKQAQEISAGILQPIYKIAEQLSFPAFHWIAFAIMAAGVVSYALQLLLTKLILLLRASLSLAEVFSDALGLIISVVGLVLTTQAATENSEFTRSPFLVISASAVGLIVGFIFYRWGHKQETQALKGRRVERMGAK